MNILLIYTNVNGFHEYCYSFGLASIVSSVRLKGHNVRVLIVRSKNEYFSVLEEIRRTNPRVVGFSSVSSQFPVVKDLSELIKKKFPDIITVCGGVHPTINPGCVLDADHLDAVFVGESESSFNEFLDNVKNGKPYEHTDNLAYSKLDKVIVNKLKPFVTDLDSLPYPDKEVYPFDESLKTLGYAPFFFSRGCPYSCSYCSNHAIAKAYNMSSNTPRYRTPGSCIREIEDTARRFPISSVYIEDDIFGLNREWREEFCEKYKKKIKIRFGCFLRANVIDETFVRLLKGAGCYRISIGIESGNEYVRNKIMNRHMSNEQIIKAFELARRYEIETNAINIIGVPGETEAMILDTVMLNKRVRPTATGVNIFYPYKGTKLGDYCFEQKMVSEQMYDNFSNERRETVLNYPEEFKKKLDHYRKNWEALVYPWDVKRHLLRFIRRTFVSDYLRKVKRTVCSGVDNAKRKIGRNYSD